MEFDYQIFFYIPYNNKPQYEMLSTNLSLLTPSLNPDLINKRSLSFTLIPEHTSSPIS